MEVNKISETHSEIILDFGFIEIMHPEFICSMLTEKLKEVGYTELTLRILDDHPVQGEDFIRIGVSLSNEDAIRIVIEDKLPPIVECIQYYDFDLYLETK